MKTYSAFIEKIVTNPKYFNILGFTIVRNVFTQDEVIHLREVSKGIFDKENPKQMLLPTHVANSPELNQVIFKPKIMTAFRMAFGDPYVQWGDFQVQRNMFGGWHTDAGSEKMAPYLYSKDYRFAKCGLFLQDNTQKWGGGIQIRLFSTYIFNRFPSIIRIPLAKIYQGIMPLLEHTLLINKGDLVFFDSRLHHSSVYPDGAMIENSNYAETFDAPHEHSKYVLYWNACNQASISGFMRNSVIRGVVEEFMESEGVEPFFLDYLSRSFPDDFDESFVKKVSDNKMIFASLEKDKADKIKELLKTMRPTNAHLKRVS
jgi:hypothetical protein